MDEKQSRIFGTVMVKPPIQEIVVQAEEPVNYKEMPYAQEEDKVKPPIPTEI